MSKEASKNKIFYYTLRVAILKEKFSQIEVTMMNAGLLQNGYPQGILNYNTNDLLKKKQKQNSFLQS